MVLRALAPAIVSYLQRTNSGPVGRPGSTHPRDQGTQEWQAAIVAIVVLSIRRAGRSDRRRFELRPGPSSSVVLECRRRSGNVTVETNGERFPARARIIRGKERAALFNKVAAANSTLRPIPCRHQPPDSRGCAPPRLRAPSALVVAAIYMDALLEGVVLRRPPYIPPYILLKSARLARQRTAVDCTKAIL